MAVDREGRAFPRSRCRLSLRALFLAGTLAILAACGGEDPPPSRPPPQPEPANTNPDADAGDNQTVNAGATVSLDGSESSDAEGAVTYSWSLAPARDDVTLSSTTAAEPTFAAPSVTTNVDLVFTLRVTDTAGATDTDTVTITINAPPSADAGDDETVAPGATVTLDGTGSSDPGGGDIDYAWTVPANSGITLSDAGVASPTFTVPAVTADADLVFTLTVTDAGRATDTDTVTIAINASPPSADAGDNETVAPGATVTLDGTDSRDPGGGGLGYAWTVPANSGITLSDANVAAPTFAAPTVTEETEYAFTLTVTDDKGASNTATVTITVAAPAPDNTPPTLQRVGYAEGRAPARTLAEGDEIRFVMTFSKAVLVRGTPRFKFTIGGEERFAVYEPPTSAEGTSARWRVPQPLGSSEPIAQEEGEGDGSTTLTFVYVVQASDDLQGGVGIPDNPLVLDAQAGDAIVSADNQDVAVDEDIPADEIGKSEELNKVITVEPTTPPATPPGTPPTTPPGTPPTTGTPNEAPNAAASGGGPKNADEPVTLDGSGSSDTDGTIASYIWTQQSPAEPTIELANENTARATFTVPAVADDTDFVFRLEVTDDDGASAAAQVTVSVSGTRPVADAGDDRPARPGTQITLDGSGSEQTGDDAIASYSWTQQSPATPVVAFEDPAVVDPVLAVPNEPDGTVFVFVLTVTSENGFTATDSVSITTSATALFADAAVTGITGREATPNTVVTLDGSGSSTGAGTIDAYLWTQQSPALPALDLADISMDADGSIVTFTAPTVSMDTDFAFRLEVTDSSGQSVAGEVTVTVPNTPPTAQAGADRPEQTNAVVTLEGSGRDPGGATIAGYAWTQQSPATPAVTLESGNTATATFTAPAVAADTIFVFQLEVTDVGGLTGTDEVSITVPGTAPAAAAGNDQTVRTDAEATLDGRGSRPTGGAAITGYSWTQQSPATPAVSLENANTATATFIVPDVPDGTSFTFRLEVVSATGLSHADEVRVTVSNTQFIVDVGDDRTRATDDVVTLDGSGSSAATGRTITGYSWTQQPPTMPAVSLENANTATATFTAPAVTVDTAFTFQLEVTDSADQTAANQVVITIPNSPPSADAGDDQVVAPSGEVTLDGSRSEDPGGGTIEYSWTQTSGAAVNLSGEATAKPTFALSVPSAVRAEVLTFELTVTDGPGLTARDSVTVTVTNNVDLVTMEDHEGAVRGVAMSRDGSVAVSGGLDGTVRLWNADTGAAIRTLGEHDGAVTAVAINADGTRAISGGLDGTVRLWWWDETGGGEVLYDGSTRGLGQGGIWVYAVALSKDGSRAASGGFDGKVRLWDTATSGAGAGQEVLFDGGTRSLGSHGQHSVYGVALSDDGDRVLSGGAGGTVRLWNADENDATGYGTLVRSLSDDDGPMGVVFGVALAGDASVAVAGTADNNVHVWNADTGDETHELTGHAADVSSVSLDEDETRVLSASGDGTVRFWNVDASDAANNGEIRVLRQHTDYVWSAALSGDGIAALSGGGDGKLHLWNTATSPADTAGTFATTEPDRAPAATGDVRSRVLPDGHGVAVRGVSLSADGRFALSGGDDGTVRLWNATSGEHLRNMTDHTERVDDVSLSADGRLALSGSHDDTVRLWDAASGAQIGEPMTGHGENVSGVSLSADGRLALSGAGGDDDTVRLWNTATGAQIGDPMTGHDQDVSAVSLSADGRRALSGSDDDTVRLWDTATGAQIGDPMTGHAGAVNGVSLNADGRLALSGSGDNTMRLWDAASGGHLRTMTGHADQILDVSLNADGRLALSGSSDNTVRLWDAASGEHLRTMTGHAGAVNGVSLSADGRLALSGSDGNAVRLWHLGRSSDAVVPGTADAHAGGNQTRESARVVTLDGSRSTDSSPGSTNGKPIAYLWRQTAGDDVVLSGSDTVEATFTAPTVTSSTDLGFALTVTDARGLVDTERITVTVIQSNDPPQAAIVVAAPPPATVGDGSNTAPSGTAVTLDGSGSMPAAGRAITSYSWEQRPPTTPLIALADDDTAKVTFIAPDVTANTDFVFRLLVTDNAGRSDSMDVTITVPNTPPVAEAGDSRSEQTKAMVVLDGSGSRDPGGGTITGYAWTQQPPLTPAVSLEDENDVTATFAAPAVAADTTLVFRLVVTDVGGLTAMDEVSITVPGTAPVAAAGNDQTERANTEATLDGGGSRPTGGAAITGYSWTQQSPATPVVSLDNANTATATFTVPDVVDGTEFTFRLEVVSATGLSHADEVRVIVSNTQIIVDVGDDRTATDEVVTLDGSKSSAATGRTITGYSWTQQSPSTPAVSLENANTATATFTAPAVTMDTAFTFELEVTDSADQTATNQVVITIPNSPPTADAGDDQMVDPSGEVTLDGSRSEDPGGGTIEYSWTQTSGAAVNLSGETTAKPTFVASAPTAIRAEVLTFQLTVTDGPGLTAQASVTVTVNNNVALITIENPAVTVRGVAMSRDGSVAVSGGLDGTVRLWNANTGAAIRTLGEHDGAVTAVAINADGTRAISGGLDGTVRLWRWGENSGGEVLYDSGTRSLGQKGIWVYAVALSKDGSRAASGGFDGKVRLWDTATSGAGTGQEVLFDGDTRSLGSHGQHSVYGVALSDDGDRVLSGGAGGTVRLWNADENDATGYGTLVRSLSDDDAMGPVFGVALSGDATVAAAGTADNNVHVWNANTGDETHELTGHAADVSSVSLDEDKTRVLSAGGDGTVRFWNVDASDTTNNGQIRVLRQHTDYVWSAALSGDGVAALSGDGDGKLHLWNTAESPMDTAETFATMEPDRAPAATGDVRSRVLPNGHGGTVESVSLSADGRLALSGSQDRTARLWNATTGEHLHTMTGHTDWVAGVSLSADGRLALSGSDDDTVRLWNTTTGVQIGDPMTDHTDWVQSVSLSADGRLALSGSRDNTVRLWDTITGAQIGDPMTGHGGNIRGVSLSADGRLALSGSNDRTVRRWNTTTGVQIGDSMTGHTDWVQSVSLSADGRRALSGSGDETIRLWNATTGAYLRAMVGHAGTIWSVALSADGRFALSGHVDQTMYLWDTTTGAILRTIIGGDSGHSFRSVSLSADGRLALSGSDSNAVRLWHLGRSNDAVVPGTAEARAGDRQTAESATMVTLDGSGSTDSSSRSTNGKPIAYFWRQTAGDDVTLSGSDTVMATFTAPTVSANTDLRFALAVTDARGLVDTGETTVTVTQSNRAPQAAIAVTQQPPVGTGVDSNTAPSGTTVTLDGSGSSAAPGRTITAYSWTQQSPPTPSVTLAGENTARATFTAPDVTVDTTFVFRLVVTDDADRVGSRDVSIIVPNTPPMAEAGESRTELTNATVILDGSGSHDPGGGSIVSHSWTQQSPETPAVVFTGERTATATFTAPAVAVETVFVFQLEVTDSAGGSHADQVSITVPSTAPVAKAGDDREVRTDDEVILDGSGSTIGGGATIKSYAWTQQSPSTPAVDLDNANTAMATFTVPDVTDGTIFTFRLEVVSSTELATTDDVDLTVLNRALIVEAGGDQEAVPGDTVMLDGSGSSAAGGGTITSFAWTQQPPLTPAVDLENANTAVATFIVPDLAANTTFVFQLEVRDSHGQTGTDQTSVSVDLPPTANAGGDQTVNPGDTVMLTGSASDPGGGAVTHSWEQTAGTPAVSLSDAGALAPTFTAPGSLRAETTLTFELTVTDANLQTTRDTVTITVNQANLFARADHGAAVRGVSVSRSNGLAVSGGLDGTVRLWDANTGEQILTLGEHDGAATAVAINADGTRAISGGLDGTVRLWTWDTAADGAISGGSEVLYESDTRSLGRRGVWVYAVALNADGSRAASGGFDGKVRVWNTDAADATDDADKVYGEEITYDDPDTDMETEANSLGSHGAHSVYGVSLSDDGSRVLSGGADGTVRLWNTGDGTEVRSLSDDDAMGVVFGVALSGDGSVAVAGTADNNVHVWNATNGDELHELSSTCDATMVPCDVTSVAINAAKTRVLSAAGDGAVRLWNVDASDTANNGEIRALRQHTQYPWSVALSGDHFVALSGGGDGKLLFWATAEQIADTTEPFATVEPDRDPATSGDLRSQVLPNGHTGLVFAVSLSADGRFALSGGSDRSVRVWNATTGAHMHTMTGHSGTVRGVSLSADGRIAFSGAEDHTVRLWDPQTGGHLRTMDGTDGHTNNVEAVSLSADGRLAVSGARDWSVRLWQVATGGLLRTMEHGDVINGVALSADGSRALAGDAATPGNLYLWDTTTGSRRALEPRPTRSIASVSLTPDGRFALSGNLDTTMGLWNAIDDEHLRTISGHDRYGWVLGVSLSADGRIILSGSRDDSVRLWDATTGEQLRIMTVHAPKNVQGVSLSADGRLALSGAEDRIVRLWHFGRSNDTVVPSTAVASAGGNQVAASASMVTLDGSGSTDERATNGKPIAYYWRQTVSEGMTTLSAADIVTLSADNTETATFTTPTVTANTILTFELTVTDTLGLLDTEEVTVTVTPPPTGSGAPRSLTGTAPHGGSNAPPVGQAPSLVGAVSLADPSTSRSAATVPASPACASRPGRAGHAVGGQLRGAHCVYPAAFLDADHPLDTDMTIAALPNGGAHVFQGSLIVGRHPGAASGPDAASGNGPQGGTNSDGPTLTIEAGAVLAFKGATHSLTVNPGARLLAVGTPDKPITLTSAADAEGDTKSQNAASRSDAGGTASPGAEVLHNPDTRTHWSGLRVNGLGATGTDAGHLEYVVVKHTLAGDAGAGTPAKAGAITLRNVASGTVVRNLQVYDAHGDGLALVDGAVHVDNFVSVYARGDSIKAGAGWSGTLANALVIQPEHEGDHCLNIQDTAPGQRGDGPRATISGLTCITSIASPHASADAVRGLGAGIRIGAGTTPVIRHSLVVGTFRDDTDARANYCLHIDGITPQAADHEAPATSGPALVGNIFACEDKTGGAAVAAWATNRNNQFADVEAPTDPTTATDTQLQLLGGTPPVYSLDYDDLRINGADATVEPPEGVDFPGAASESAAPSWLRPGGIDWTHGIFEGSRTKPLWFEYAP